MPSLHLEPLHWDLFHTSARQLSIICTQPWYYMVLPRVHQPWVQQGNPFISFPRVLRMVQRLISSSDKLGQVGRVPMWTPWSPEDVLLSLRSCAGYLNKLWGSKEFGAFLTVFFAECDAGNWKLVRQSGKGLWRSNGKAGCWESKVFVWLNFWNYIMLVMLVMLNLAASWKFLAIRMTTKCDSCQQTTKPTFLDLKSMADVKGLLMLPNTGVTLTKQEEPKLSQLSSALCLQPKVRPLEGILHDSFSMPCASLCWRAAECIELHCTAPSWGLALVGALHSNGKHIPGVQFRALERCVATQQPRLSPSSRWLFVPWIPWQ